MNRFSKFLKRAWRPGVATAFILFVVRSVGCQFDVTGNPDVNLLNVHAFPGLATVPVNGRLFLSATVTGFQQSNHITWTVIGANNGRMDTINGLPVYFAPGAPATFPALPVEIRAVPDEDPTRYVSCMVHLVTPEDAAIAISPDTVLLLTNQVQQFDTIWLAPSVGPVRWSLVSGPGSISQTGVYTPPSSVLDTSTSVASTVAIVQVTSLNDPSVFSTATINLHNATDSLLCFSRDVLPVLSGACGTSGCHDAAKRAAGYDFNTYAGTKGSLRGGSTARSTRLYNSIIQFNAASRMPPPPSPALTPNQVRIIGRWINDGALDCQ